MKKFYVVFVLTLLAFSSAFSQTSAYPGNDSTGFDGAIGTGSLQVNYDGTNLNFTLTKGSGTNANFNDVLVIYLDNGNSGGFTTTALFTDVSSGLAQAITGEQSGNPTNHGILTFPSGFAPKYALAFASNSSQGAVLDSLNVGTYSTITSPSLTNNGSVNSATYEVSVTPQELGWNTNVPLRFIGTYISNTGYRSNEAFGINFPAGTGNLAWNDFTDTSAALVFDAAGLAVDFGTFNGILKGNTAELTWNTRSEADTRDFNVQKSVDGSNWNTIGSVNAKNSISGSAYSYVDNDVTATTNYYRLQIMNKDGSFAYTSMIIIHKNVSHAITILGNPSTGGAINMNITDDGTYVYQLSLYSPDGKLIAAQTFNQAGGTSSVRVNVPNGTRGLCLLKVSNGTTAQTFKVLVQ